MALKVLMLRSRLTPLLAELQAFEATRAGFAAREAELERDIAAAQTDEERSVVENAVNTFEQERSTNAAEIARVQQAIDAINDEIRSLEAAQTPPPAPQPDNDAGATNHKRSVQPMPIIDTERRWFGLTYQQRDAGQHERISSAIPSAPRPAEQRDRRRARHPDRVHADPP